MACCKLQLCEPRSMHQEPLAVHVAAGATHRLHTVQPSTSEVASSLVPYLPLWRGGGGRGKGSGVRGGRLAVVAHGNQALPLSFARIGPQA